MDEDKWMQFLGEQFKILEEDQKFIDLEYAARLGRITEEIQKSLSGHRITVQLHRDKPYKFMDYISITGKRINMRPEVFATMTALADNVEVYPRTDGVVQINFTFTKPEVRSCRN